MHKPAAVSMESRVWDPGPAVGEFSLSVSPAILLWTGIYLSNAYRLI